MRPSQGNQSQLYCLGNTSYPVLMLWRPHRATGHCGLWPCALWTVGAVGLREPASSFLLLCHGQKIETKTTTFEVIANHDRKHTYVALYALSQTTHPTFESVGVDFKFNIAKMAGDAIREQYFPVLKSDDQENVAKLELNVREPRAESRKGNSFLIVIFNLTVCFRRCRHREEFRRARWTVRRQRALPVQW